MAGKPATVSCPKCEHQIKLNSLAFRLVHYACGRCNQRYTLEMTGDGWVAVPAGVSATEWVINRGQN